VIKLEISYCFLFFLILFCDLFFLLKLFPSIFSLYSLIYSLSVVNCITEFNNFYISVKLSVIYYKNGRINLWVNFTIIGIRNRLLKMF